MNVAVNSCSDVYLQYTHTLVWVDKYTVLWMFPMCCTYVNNEGKWEYMKSNIVSSKNPIRLSKAVLQRNPKKDFPEIIIPKPHACCYFRYCENHCTVHKGSHRGLEFILQYLGIRHSSFLLGGAADCTRHHPLINQDWWRVGGLGDNLALKETDMTL